MVERIHAQVLLGTPPATSSGGRPAVEDQAVEPHERRTSGCPAAPGDMALALAEAADEGVTKQGPRPEALVQRGDEPMIAYDSRLGP
jgi:hypothetical protein